jgi:hypothetical protein
MILLWAFPVCYYLFTLFDEVKSGEGQNER